MLGIHVSKGTAEGWFGKGIAHAILSITITIVVILGIAAVLFFAGRAIGGTTNTPAVTNPNPSVPVEPGPTSPTPIEPTSNQTPTMVTEPGVVVLTVEELINQVVTNPDKYKQGTVMKITGVAGGFDPTQTTIYLNSSGWEIVARLDRFKDNGVVAAIINGQVRSYPDNPTITIQATFSGVGLKSKYIELRDATLVTDAK